MVNGILSSHEATVIVNLTDANTDKPLSKITDLFTHNFREDTSRVRAVFALRTLLALESTQPVGAVLPTSPETIAMLYLLHVAATDNSSPKTISSESREFAAAALYEHLLRVEDLLRDDSLMYETRKYKSTAAVGGNKGKGGGARDALEKDAYRGHLLQKVFILHCALLNNSDFSGKKEDLIADLAQTFNGICTNTNTNTTLENLETIVAAWSSDATLKQSVGDSLALLKKSYDREIVNNSSSSLVQGAPQGNNFMAGSFLHRAVPMPQNENSSSVAQSKKHTKHFLTAGDLAVAFASSSSLISSSNSVDGENSGGDSNSNNSELIVPQTAVLTPAGIVMAPPRGHVAGDARLLLPSSNPFIFDAIPHPQDWREAKTLVETAVSGAELSAQQLTKLTSLLESNNNSSNGGENGKKNGAAPAPKKAASVKKKGDKDEINNSDLVPTDAFPYLGITPSAFGKIARSNPKVAIAVVNRLASELSTNKQLIDSYIQQIIDFNHSSNPDYCPSVVLAASKAGNGVLTAAHLSTYVSRAKSYAMSCINAKEKSDFLKNFLTSLHQVAEKTPLDSGDKAVISSLLTGGKDNSDLADVVKMWS